MTRRTHRSYRSYNFLVTANGQRSAYEVEAHSKQQALSLLGVTYAQENPGLIPNAVEFRIEDQ